jgi:hypothetical protein
MKILITLLAFGCAAHTARTGLVLGDEGGVYLVDNEGQPTKLRLLGDAKAVEQLLGCRVKVRGQTGLGPFVVQDWKVLDSGYGVIPFVGQLEHTGSAWRMRDTNSGALVEFLAESLGGLGQHAGDLVLVDGFTMGPHLVKVVSYRVLIDRAPIRGGQ